MSLENTGFGHEGRKLREILFDILEIFVIKGQVTGIPEDIFLEFISYQCEKKSDIVVERAILQNKAPFDGSKLLSLLHSK